MPPMLTTTRCASGLPKHRRVKLGHERRSLPARRDVARPEIGGEERGHVRVLGHAGRVVELQRPALLGTMPHRLAVNAAATTSCAVGYAR